MRRLLAPLALLPLALAMTSAFAQDGPAKTPPVADLARMVLRDPDAPIAGNPNGDVTIVAFEDYNCPFCRRSTPQLAAFVASDPNVRVIFKDWPILSEASVMEAKVALAAKYQGKYRQAHEALMGIDVRPATKHAVKAAMAKAGIDVDRLNKDLAAHNEDINALLLRNVAEADALGLKGTPVFLIGPFKMAQELDEAGFRQVVADARARAARAGPGSRGLDDAETKRAPPAAR